MMQTKNTYSNLRQKIKQLSREFAKLAEEFDRYNV